MCVCSSVLGDELSGLREYNDEWEPDSYLTWLLSHFWANPSRSDDNLWQLSFQATDVNPHLLGYITLRDSQRGHTGRHNGYDAKRD